MKPLQHCCVLVVENHSDTRELLAFILADAGAIVTTVQSASEAIAALNWLQPDILLTSLAMPHMHGSDLLQCIRQQAPKAQQRLPIVAITTMFEESKRPQILAAGFADYLPKPIDFATLIAAIERLLPSAAKLIPAL